MKSKPELAAGRLATFTMHMVYFDVACNQLLHLGVMA